MLETLSKSELEVMEIFWDKNVPLSARDLIGLLKNNKRSDNTIRTFIQRIAQKGFISLCDTGDVTNYYECVVSRQEYKHQEAEHFLNEKFQGSLQSFLIALTNDSIGLSLDDIKELDDVVGKKGED